MLGSPREWLKSCWAASRGRIQGLGAWHLIEAEAVSNCCLNSSQSGALTNHIWASWRGTDVRTRLGVVFYFRSNSCNNSGYLQPTLETLLAFGQARCPLREIASLQPSVFQTVRCSIGRNSWQLLRWWQGSGWVYAQAMRGVVTM